VRIPSGTRIVSALVVFLCACRGEDTADQGFTVRDSAGVRIVEHGEAPNSGWRVGTEARFTVGWDPDGPSLTWPQSGRILPDGGALIGEQAAGTIYHVGPDGSVVERWGRKGAGPGEYERMESILLAGDSILVSDGSLRRITILSSSGALLATRRLEAGFLQQVSSVLTDGRLLLIPGEGYSMLTPTRPEWGFETQPILAMDLTGSAVDTLADLPHLRRWYGDPSGHPGVVHIRGRAGGFEDGFAWARADEPEVRWYDGLGRLVQVARWDEDPLPLTTERGNRIAQIYEESMRSGGYEEAFVTAQLADIHTWLDRFEGPLPYWDFLHVDRVGNAWLSQHALPARPAGAWRVLARDGSYPGWVEMPDVVAILDITQDRILAVRFDELDVPAVVMLELIKPPQTRGRP
jgi:hypothetical protein